jgi:hypothetical protein
MSDRPRAMFEPYLQNEGVIYSDGYVYISVAEIIMPGYRRHLEGANVAVIADVDKEYAPPKWYDLRTLLMLLKEPEPVCVRIYTDDGPEDMVWSRDIWFARRVALAVNKAIFERNRVPSAG